MPEHDAEENSGDDFLIREGLSLLAAFRLIRSPNARHAVLTLIASIVEAEEEARAVALTAHHFSSKPK